MPQPCIVEKVPIDTVGPDPANVRLHPPRSIDAIKASLLRFGQQRPILVSQDGVIRAGSGTWQAACDLGWREIEVRWTDLEGMEATAYSIADNRTAEHAEWDESGLAALLQAMQDDAELLAATGFGDEDLHELLALPSDGEAEEAPEPQVDRAAELQAEWGTERGQLWEIPGKAGVHRVLCGDSTKAENWQKCELVVTSPPYPAAEMWNEQGEGGFTDNISRLYELGDAIYGLCREFAAVTCPQVKRSKSGFMSIILSWPNVLAT